MNLWIIPANDLQVPDRIEFWWCRSRRRRRCGPQEMGITHGPDLCPASCEWGAANWELMPDDVAQMSGNRRPNKRSTPKRAESQNAASPVMLGQRDAIHCLAVIPGDAQV